MKNILKKIGLFFGLTFCTPMLMHWSSVLLEHLFPRGQVYGLDSMLLGLGLFPMFTAFFLAMYWNNYNTISKICLVVVLSFLAFPVAVFVVEEQTTTDYIIPAMTYCIAPLLALVYVPYDYIMERYISADRRNKHHEPGNESIGRGSLS